MSEFNFYADQLRVDTPEQVDLHFPVAGVGSRFIAILLDSLIQGAGLFVLYLILILTAVWSSLGHRLSSGSDTSQKWMIAVLVFVNFLLYWGYFVLFEAFWKGQTPGKRVMKLRVLKDSGRSITLFESMARNLIRVVDSLPSMYLTGLITMLCNRRNKRLGDYVAGTIVVHELLDEQPALAHTNSILPGPGQVPGQAMRSWMPGAREAWEAGEVALPDDAVARLGSGDLHVIETFFARALDLPIARRAELSARLAERMCSKMAIAVPAGVPPERVLEGIAYRMRGQGR